MTPADFILPVLLVVVWASSWSRGTRRFRLWFALLAPAGCGAGVVVGVFGALAGADGSCPSSTQACDGSAVQRWGAGVDAPSSGSAWLVTSSLAALGVAVVLSVGTLVVEYVRMVRRDGHGTRSPGGGR